MPVSHRIASLALALITLCSAAAADVLPSQPIKVFGTRSLSEERMTDETVDGNPAACLALDQRGLTLCDIVYKEGFYLELRLSRGQTTFARLLTTFSVASGLGNFDAAFVDLNHDNRPALLVTRMTSSGNGIIIATHGLAVFLPDGDGYRLADWLDVQGIGLESGLYKKGASIYLEESDWLSSCKIDTGPCGTYLAANWYRWEQDHFVHDTQLPVAVRRLRKSFLSEMSRHSTHYPWFLDGRAKQLVRHDLPKYIRDTSFDALLEGPQRAKPIAKCTLEDSNFVGWVPCADSKFHR